MTRGHQRSSERGRSFTYNDPMSTVGLAQSNQSDPAASSARGHDALNYGAYAWLDSPNYRRNRHPELIFTEQQALAELWSPTRSLSGSSRHSRHLNHVPLVIPRENEIQEEFEAEHSFTTQSDFVPGQSTRVASFGPHPTSSPLVIPRRAGLPAYHPNTSSFVVSNNYGISGSEIANPFTPAPAGVNSPSWKSDVETYVPTGSRDSKKKTPGPSSPQNNPFADPLPMDTIVANIEYGRQYPKRMSKTERPQSRDRLEREYQAREIAHEQERKLQRARAEYHRLRVSSRRTQTPTSILLLATRSNLTPKKLVHCWPFWVSLLTVQVGIISTAASIPFVVNNNKHDRSATIGNGVIFWLIISVITTVAGIFFCVVIYLRKRRGGAPRWVCTLGLDEIENDPRGPVEPDIEREVGPDAQELDMRPTPERRRVAHAQLLDENQMPIIRPELRDPMWYALYSRPEGVREYLSRVQQPVRNSELLNGANSDIGVQVLQPAAPVEEVIHHHQRRFQVFTPQLTKINPAKLRDDSARTREDNNSITPSISVSVMPAKRPAGAARYFGSSREETPVGYGSKRGLGKDEVVMRTEKDDKLGSASRRSIVGSELESYSPLEDLARDLSRKDVLEMLPNERAEYLAQRRRQSEDRSLRTRASLTLERTTSRGVARWPTVSAYGMVGDETDNGIELATLKEQEGYLADVESEQTDGGDKGAGLHGMRLEGKVQRLRRMWEEGETYNSSLGSRHAP